MIQHIVHGTVLKTGDRSVNEPVTVEMAFDEENDPLAVQMIFTVEDQGEVCWTMSRDLVMNGAFSPLPYGTGDIRFRSERFNDRVLVCLRPPGGHADLGLNRTELIDFLNRTQAVCKLGEEPVESLIEEELKEMFGS